MNAKVSLKCCGDTQKLGRWQRSLDMTPKLFFTHHPQGSILRELESQEVIRFGLARSRVESFGSHTYPTRGIVLSGEPWSYQKDRVAKYEINLAHQGRMVAIAR
eukprot:4850017-Pleurochrysis_carterae.AAC.3